MARTSKKILISKFLTSIISSIWGLHHKKGLKKRLLNSFKNIVEWHSTGLALFTCGACVINLPLSNDNFKGSLSLSFFNKPLCEVCAILLDICLQPFLHAHRVSSPPFLFTSLLSFFVVFPFRWWSFLFFCWVSFPLIYAYPDYSFLSYFSYFISSFQLLGPFLMNFYF